MAAMLASGAAAVPGACRSRVRRREIGEELADSVRIQRRLFANPALVDRVIAAAARDPKLCRLFARVALGEESLRRCKWRLAARFVLASLRRRLRPG